ncbi:MAG: hypothetical protein A3F82_06780 [Deltaproteobacteria bacterium RIFCSPLOWO2_12_FULL_44_12]|nr:MAG: hypothetical protein A2712_09615 [Deltaproteobacteria bacterium RIFCSPHIGHO2_01_FULL_43_49]OGQ14926.1 MAG: hypothetical protein A3D22_00070 [Deltaproteobacteria bacterium RIFCSPHIGHO2_02_FULL_44_53]OGQ29570.1 MAG: hypothetical protein A3D98_10345 [Deltaproteobacteria bacterium RIFCSPHIGHO2_12_FULL_44_21]OGQ31038.1 MAG: hypothetical protein A2979_06360 [Deltaproteobacteria bacterium RIFCSPLOWO2_01_FULL_45_74]OGQ42640.1 MAG: hypothetical protein A3I70_02030 [Deltaproteobacteria bacterium 
MEHKHYTNINQIPKPPAFTMSRGLHFIYLGLVIIGIEAFLIALRSDPDRAWHNFLLNYFYWLCLSLSGLFFVALQYVTGSMWSTPLRRVPEALIGYLPVAFVLLLILFLGKHHLYEWTHLDEVLHDPILIKKSAYLNFSFFAARNFFSFLVWGLVGFWLVKNSLKQDRNGDVKLTKLNKKISAPFLVVFGITFTVMCFDLLMSLEPHWYSTIFGIYCFAGLFYSGMAITILFVVAMKKQGALADVVNENHLHDLGKFMFAFCVFWAYIAFSQYMLIWYANLPEEIGYMIRRTEGAWTPVALALLFGKFVIPFFLLLSRDAKRNEKFLVAVAVWVLVFQWLDCYWMIFPLLGEKPVFGWQEIGIFLGFLGLFVLTVTLVLQKIPPVPMKDPRLLEGVNHHQ